MFTEKQLKEIREHLNRSQNPIFFFDNDIDGLASFLLLRRYIDRGKGVAIRSFPDLNPSYAKKIHELKSDYVFVLDKPRISDGFIEEVKKLNLPLVWIDHHENKESETKDYGDNMFVYNTMHGENKSPEPVSYWAYKISKNKNELWISIIGCVGDGFLPEFSSEFREDYPEMWGVVRTAFQGLYETKIGEIARMLSFALKDRTSNVVRMLKFLVEVKNPHDLLEENKNTLQIFRRYNQIGRSYKKLLDKAKRIGKLSKKILYFQYGGQLSLSADISNELFYLFPDKVIVVAYLSGIKANISLRGNIENIDMNELTKKAIHELENASGGGHKHATGAQVQIEDLPKFKKKLGKLLT